MPPKKRKDAGKQQDSGSTNKQSKQDGQKAVSHEIDVPIDEGFKQDGTSENLTTDYCQNRSLAFLYPTICPIVLLNWIFRLTIHKGSAKVHIDGDGIIFDASLNQTNIGGNNNKVCLPAEVYTTQAEVV